MSESGGIVLKGDDGSVYFIRDEILEAAKLEGEYLEAAQPVIDAGDAEVEGFALNARSDSFTSIGSFGANPIQPQIQVQAQNPVADLGKIKQMSTVMCPW
jgi:hypothetical protein